MVYKYIFEPSLAEGSSDLFPHFLLVIFVYHLAAVRPTFPTVSFEYCKPNKMYSAEHQRLLNIS